MYDKIKLFMESEMIISSHSSALTLTLFCNKLTKIIEIVNQGTRGFDNSHYIGISKVLDLHYRRYSNIQEDPNGNFKLNVNEFEKYLINEYVTMGKYTIYQDKKVKYKMATGEELTGKWSYNKETQTIDANFNGKIVNVPCAPGAENPEKNTEPEKVTDPTTARYRVCTGTYTKGCKTDPTGAIGQVQQCLDLVVDGKFWNKTQAALVAKGFADGFKDSDIAKICGGTQTSIAQNMELKLPTPEDDLNSLNPY
jgi:hypothetical protein